MGDRLATWVYAVVAAGRAAPAVTGVADEPLRLVESGRLAAVVGSVDLPAGDDALQRQLRDAGWLEHAARRHHEVVAACAAAGATVPLRLATVYRDDSRVREMLRHHAATLQTCLEAVAGREEWGVQAYLLRPEPTAAASPPPAPARRVPAAAAPAVAPGQPSSDPAPEPAAAAPGPGTAYLWRRRAEHAARRAARNAVAAAVEHIHAELSRLAAAARHQTPAGGGYASQPAPALNASYLVDADVADRFRAEVRRLDLAHDNLALRLTGPWPAYSFVDVEPEGDA
ncbi:MAG: GvpL/GvpF family gas vesicle protein [Micromonosporaceae bacterium]|jgi:hypothetical protein